MLSLTCLNEATRHEQKSSKKIPELIPYQGKPEVLLPKNRIHGDQRPTSNVFLKHTPAPPQFFRRGLPLNLELPGSA